MYYHYNYHISHFLQGIHFHIFQECYQIHKNYQIFITGTIFIAQAYVVETSQPCCFKHCPIPMNHFHLQFHHQANQEILDVMEANSKPGKRKMHKKISDTLQPRQECMFKHTYIRNVWGHCMQAHLVWQDSHDLLAICENFFNKNNFPDQNNWQIAKIISCKKYDLYSMTSKESHVNRDSLLRNEWVATHTK